MTRLARSTAKVDFFRLANQFEGQQSLGYCGPTSVTIVLNALRADNTSIAKPRDEAATRALRWWAFRGKFR
jgi:hypothetical protein